MGFLLHKSRRKSAKHIGDFSEETLNHLVDYSWPLNIDELHQVVERAVVISENGIITGSQVFMNPEAFSAHGRFNLLRLQPVHDVVTHPLFPRVLLFLATGGLDTDVVSCYIAN